MAKISFRNLEQYELQLAHLRERTPEIAGKAIYAGAEIVTDAIRANIEALPAVSDKAGLIAYQKKDPAPLTETAKRGLLDGLGITPMKDENGFYNVKIGFDGPGGEHGYNDLRTQKYPKGQPNVLIARSLESGSSISPKHPFVRPAINASRKRAEAKMAEVLDEEIGKIMDTD